jgi:hypothetical protein
MSTLKVSDVEASSSSAVSHAPSTPVIVAPVDPKIEAAKKIKALRKKLRDIEEIALKNKEELTPEQVEKLSRRSDIETEIERWAAV